MTHSATTFEFQKLLPEISLAFANSRRRTPQCKSCSVSILKHDSHTAMLLKTILYSIECIGTCSAIGRNSAVPKTKALWCVSVKRQKHQIPPRIFTSKFERNRRRNVASAITRKIDLIAGTTCHDCFTDTLPKSRRPSFVTVVRVRPTRQHRDTGCYEKGVKSDTRHLSNPINQNRLTREYHADYPLEINCLTAQCPLLEPKGVAET